MPMLHSKPPKLRQAPLSPPVPVEVSPNTVLNIRHTDSIYVLNHDYQEDRLSMSEFGQIQEGDKDGDDATTTAGAETLCNNNMKIRN
jgi:hypothetical protein